MALPQPASLQLLLDSFVAIASESSEEAILEQAVDLARLCTRARYGAAATLGPDGVQLFVHVGLTSDQVAALPHLPRGRGVLGAVLEDKAPVRLERLQDHPGSVGFPLHHVAMAAFLGVPILFDDQLLGGLYLTKPPGHGTFDSDDELFVEALGRQTAMALEACRMLQHKDRINAELRAADELKSEFIAMASHELRSPLTSIQAAAEIMARMWGSLDEAHKLDLVHTIEGQAIRLSRMVDDILTAAKLEAGVLPVHPRPVVLAAAAASAAAEFGADRDAIRLECPSDLVGVADPAHLQQILVNLIGNALKYGRPPYRVTAAESGADRVALRVSDQGPGVPTEFVAQLFRRFSRAPAEQAQPGTGLGLSIAHSLAAGFGGELGYEGGEGRGATFVLVLRRSDEPLGD